MDPREHKKIGPVLEVTTSYLHGKHGVEIRIMSLSRDDTHSWVRISHGSNKFVMNYDTEIPEEQLEEYALQLDAKDFACRSKAKAKPQKKRTCWLSTKNRSHGKEELDRYWTREIFSLRIRRIEESNSSSSSFTESTSRRRWSGSFLQKKGKSSESMPTIYSLVWRSMVSMFGSKRRRKKEIPVLYWCFRNNCLFPSSRTQSYWSFITGQCGNSEQLLPVHIPCRMCFQFAFYHQLWIKTWRSKFEQKTDSVLLAFRMCVSSSFDHQQRIDTWRSGFKQETNSILLVYWSQGQSAQRSWIDGLECTASCTIPA